MKLSAIVRAASVVCVVAFVAILCGTSSGCEAIANGDLPNFHCAGGLDAGGCPQGQYCMSGSCIPCATTDICDGIDNDCDGVVDNGSDQDGDGYKICELPNADGTMQPADCDDNDPAVHPGATEVCNGIDDDCNHKVDDGVCPAGQTCAPARKQCLTPEQLCDPSTCKAPKVCDKATQQCVNPTANYDVGEPCQVDKECMSGLCAGADALGAALLGGASPGATGVCATTCCTSAGCPAGFVCYAAPPGGRYCVKAAAVGRGSTGSLGPAASCGTDSTACRSGSCVQGICVDTCCADSDCPTDQACRLVDVDQNVFYGCAAPPGGTSRNGTCSSASSCRSAFCDNYDGVYDRCVAPCCTSANSACGSIFSGSTPIACVDYQSPERGVKVMACAATSDGSGRFGDTCTGTADCASRRCENGKCTDVCCTDRDCPQPFLCRPQPTTGQLRCVSP